MDPLLAECLAAPHDDAPRLVWADRVGGERGELVTVQCALARGGLAPAESARLRRRQRELVETHGAEWSGLRGLVSTCWYRRGFVEVARTRARTLIDRTDEVFASAPFLSSVELDFGSCDQMVRALELPSLARIRGLQLPAFAELDQIALAEGDAITRLESLRFQQLDLHAIGYLERRQLAGLRRLGVSYSVHSHVGLPRLLASLTGLRALELFHYSDPTWLVRSFPPSIIELVMGCPALDALASSPLAATIERLGLSNVYSGRDLEKLEAFPRLRSLALDLDHSAPLTAKGFASARLPASVRELRASRVTVDGATSLVDRYGESLELLDLSVEAADVAAITALAPRVAGDLYVHRMEYSRLYAPPFAGDVATAPYWDYPFAYFR